MEIERGMLRPARLAQKKSASSNEATEDTYPAAESKEQHLSSSVRMANGRNTESLSVDFESEVEHISQSVEPERKEEDVCNLVQLESDVKNESISLDSEHKAFSPSVASERELEDFSNAVQMGSNQTVSLVMNEEFIAINHQKQVVREQIRNLKQRIRSENLSAEEKEELNSLLQKLERERKALETKARKAKMSPEELQLWKANNCKRQMKHIFKTKEKIQKLEGAVENLASKALIPELSGPQPSVHSSLQIDNDETVNTQLGTSRELRRLAINSNPTNAPTSTCNVKKEADRLFCLEYLKVMSHPRQIDRPFCAKNDLTITKTNLQTNTSSTQKIQGHLIGYLAKHTLATEAVFDEFGFLDIDATFLPLIEKFPAVVRDQYSIDELRLVFSGLRVLRNGCGKWIGERQLREFGDHLRSLTNQFYEKHPNILRTGTIQDEGAASNLDRPSKMLYVADDSIYANIYQAQQQFVKSARSDEDLKKKLNLMKRKTLPLDQVFGRKFALVPQIQNELGSCFAGPLQYCNVNFTHSPIAPHFDRAGFAGTNDFTGAGASIATMRLQGPAVFILLQELPHRCKGRFPIVLFFTLESQDLWALTGNARFLTNHGVYPSLVPSLGTDAQPHSVFCPSDSCCMSITMRFGDVSPSEWNTMLSLRGEI